MPSCTKMAYIFKRYWARKIHTVYLKQKGLMKLEPDQKEWLIAEAESSTSILINLPFIWRSNIYGRVTGPWSRPFRDGQGKMQIKLAGIIPVVNVGK